jgi:hypothetical protein
MGWAVVGYVALSVLVVPAVVGVVLPAVARESCAVALPWVVLASAASTVALGVFGVFTLFAAR